LAVVAGMKKTNDHAEPTNVERLKNNKTKNFELFCVLAYNYVSYPQDSVLH